MTQQTVSFDERVRLYWLYFAIGLFFVIVLDMFTTMVATAQYGVGVESNPLMRWLLLQGPVALAVVHVAVTLVVVVFFSRVLKALRQASAPADRYLERTIQMWLVLMIAVGVFLVTNNVSAILFERTVL